MRHTFKEVLINVSCTKQLSERVKNEGGIISDNIYVIYISVFLIFVIYFYIVLPIKIISLYHGNLVNSKSVFPFFEKVDRNCLINVTTIIQWFLFFMVSQGTLFLVASLCLLCNHLLNMLLH